MKNREKKYGKYMAMAIAMFIVLTVFSSMPSALGNQNNTYSSNIQEITKIISIDIKDVNYVSGPTGNYIVINGLRLSDIPGKPMLPIKTMRFYLPLNAKVVDVKMSGSEYVNYGTVKISPAPLPVLKDGRALPAKYLPPKYDPNVYNVNSFYPAKDFSYTVEHTKNATVVNVLLYPVKYNPVTGYALILKNSQITVEYEITEVKRATTAVIDVPNIIITSPQLKNAAQRLADFHNATGLTSWVVTTDWIASHYTPASTPPFNGYANDTTDVYEALGTALPLDKSMIIGYNYTLARKIVAFLQNESTGSNVTYITIFGNARMVPPSYYWTDQFMYLLAYLGWWDYYDAWIPTDAFYGSPNYNSTSFNFAPTFMVGRIPVNPMTADAVVDKIIYYAQHKTGGIQNLTLSGGQVFETPYFLGEMSVTETLNLGWLDGLKVTEYFHTLRNFTFNNFIKMMNNSDMIVETTHGSGFSFWHHNDEVSAWDFSMNASYSSLPVYISSSCLNGAWDEEMFPSYEVTYGINGGTSIAEKMLYAPNGIIAYFGADRESYGSTYAYFDHGTLVAPNNFGDLLIIDGTTAGYFIGAIIYGSVTLGLMEYYALADYDYWLGSILHERDAEGYGWNNNPWARSYFEYTLLGDPALQVAGGPGSAPSYQQPNVEIPNAEYNADDEPIITRDVPVTVNISTDSPTVKAELLYLEHDQGYSPYYGDMEDTYYDFILNQTILTPVASSGGVNNFTYIFTPHREGTYILSVYGEDGKTTRFYMACGMPKAPPLKVQTSQPEIYRFASQDTRRASGPDVRVITILDYGDIMYGKSTNATAVVYNDGDTTATNVVVHFYLENYTLIFNDNNLSHPLIWLGNVTISSIPAGGFAYATISWKGVNLWAINHTWDPYNSSARWQYMVANAEVSGDVNTDNNANWALLRVHLKLDVWAQKVFLEKDPVLNQPNNITVELTNVGTDITSNTIINVTDDYGVIATITDVHIAPGETVFITVPWTPSHDQYDNISVQISTPGDNNTANDVGYYYTNAYDGVTEVKVLTYDITPVNITQIGKYLRVQVYNYGPLSSEPVAVDIYEYAGIVATDIESPHPYPNNYDHTWEIDAPAGAKGISLHFKYLEVEDGWDYVYIYNASYDLVAYYTGFYSDLWTDFIPGPKVYVELVSDGSVNYNGFYIDAYATNIVYVGTVNVGSIPSGGFATTDLDLLYGNAIAGNCGFKLVAHPPRESATHSTGGSTNDVKSIVDRTVTDVLPPELTPISPMGVYNGSARGDTHIVVKWHDPIYSGFESYNVSIDGYYVTASSITITQIDANDGYLNVTLPFRLADGTHTVFVEMKDNSGNYNSTSWTFQVDTVGPTLTITSPPNGNVPLTYDSTLWINGTTDPDANVTINGVEVSVDANGNFSYEVTLVDGLNIFVVTATDPVGNSVSETVTALYLPQLPQLWDNISKLQAEINNLQNEINELSATLQQEINNLNATLQNEINELQAQINTLQTELNENVTALYNAINDAKVDLINRISENITALNTKIQQLQTQIDDINKDINSINKTNKKQDNGISLNEILGIIGIVLALIAIGLAAVALARKKEKPLPQSMESEEVEEETSEEEQP